MDGKIDYKAKARPFSVIDAFRGYVERVCAIPGMKAILVDSEAMAMLSLVESQTNIIGKQVFIVERIDAQKAKSSAMQHLKAVCLLRPNRAGIEALCKSLRSPKYREYHVFFTNFASDADLRTIAVADEHELVKQVQEYYADFYAVNHDLWHVGEMSSRGLYAKRSHWTAADDASYNRNVEGILAVLLAARRRPEVRYQKASFLARTLAVDVVSRMKEENEMFDFRDPPPLLVILDRRQDPIAPLLTQWTYQAMVHQLLGLVENRVDMSGVPRISEELREIVLGVSSDEFFARTYTLNFGDLGAVIRKRVGEYKKKAKSGDNLNSIADMQRFVEQYPEIKSFIGNVNKHVAVMAELSRMVTSGGLMNVSTVEQGLACDDSHSTAVEAVLSTLGDDKVSFIRKACIAALYNLRYEKTRNEMPQIQAILRDRARTPRDRELVRLCDEVVLHAGAAVRGQRSDGGFLSIIKKAFSGGLTGIQNVYTRYKPTVSTVLDNAAKGKLSTNDYPYLDTSGQNTDFKQIFIYVVGGVTYSEAAIVSEFNKANPNGPRFILGGSCVHNSESFANDILQIKKRAADVRLDIS